MVKTLPRTVFIGSFSMMTKFCLSFQEYLAVYLLPLPRNLPLRQLIRGKSSPGAARDGFGGNSQQGPEGTRVAQVEVQNRLPCTGSGRAA
jgi:hypothetical protein